MKRLFVVADTHWKIVVPPSDCVSVHCGDFVDAFDECRKPSRWKRHYNEVVSRYQHVVRGNHEDILIRKFPADDDIKIWRALPHVIYFEVEQVRVRVCHTIYLPREGQQDFAPVPLSLIPNMFSVLENENCQIIICGHDHRQYHFERDGMHIVNPGFGQKGKYASIDIDGIRCSVGLHR